MNNIFLFSILLSTVHARDITIGFLVPITGSFDTGIDDASAATLAIEYINQNKSILPNHNVTFKWRDSSCKNYKALGEATELLHNIDAFIGPACTKSCLSVGLLAKYYDIPVVSFSCSSPQLSDKSVYSTFARTKPFSRATVNYSSEVFLSIVKHFGWKYITILTQNHEAWSDIGESLRTLAVSKSIKVLQYHKLKFTNKSLERIVDDTKKSSRVYCILAYAEEVEVFLKVAKTNDLLNGENAIITMDTVNSDKELFNGVLDLSVYKPPTEVFGLFAKNVTKRMRDAPFFMNTSVQASVNAAYIYDAFLLYALALNKTLQRGYNISQGTEIFNDMVNTTFPGKSGVVALTKEGNRIPNFQIFNYWNGTKRQIASYDSTTSSLSFHPNNASIIWPGGSSITPTDASECIINNINCAKDELKDGRLKGWILYIVVSVGIFVFIIIVTCFLFYFIRKSRADKLNNLQSCIVKYNDIIFEFGNSKAFGLSTVKGLDTITMNSFHSNGSLPQLHRTGDQQRFTLIGTYKSNVVAVKRLEKDKVSLNKEILHELKQVRDIQHMNINPYVGVCVDWLNVCILSMYCNKGSLQDILHNDSIKLDWSFQLSFAKDIAEGMSALHHSAVGYHGNLNSSNCLVDSRWVCKVADYGLEKFKADQCTEKDLEEMPRKIFFGVHQNTYELGVKSQPGDVFSYGIILQEIITRDHPYPGTFSSYEEICYLVKKRTNPVYRPIIPDGVCDKPYLSLMQKCWSEEPNDRPDFGFVKISLNKMSRGRKVNLVDNMISMMEKYTNNLEEIVEERTKLLQVEKAKTDALLYEMMPKVVADQLKTGNVVRAESFEQVTVFFSDIVGFTSIAAQSTPFEVVNLLNELYTVFDNVINNFNIYKVETIGDAYLVVSGLPERNGIQHAGEIATMSLHLLSKIRDFKIPHMSEKLLQLRIGIHSGPCVAGIVGVKKPRYDIFGDTVNYASRMESSGLALRIHVSQPCKRILDELGGYVLEERGNIIMKGIGPVTTYFLLNKDGFDLSLPDLSLAASLDDHDFK